MTGCVRKFDDNATMFFKISNKQLLEKYYQIWKSDKSILNMKFDKYIKTKIQTCWQCYNKFARQKNAKRKSTMQVFINDNTRFCCQNKEKVLSSNIFGGMQI